MAARCNRAQALSRTLDMREANRHVGMKALPGLGQPDPAVFAQEKRGADLIFQLGDGIADGGLAHPQLTPGTGKTGKPPRRLKDDKAAKRGKKLAQGIHKHSLSNQ